MIWLQAIPMFFLGISELAVRLPAALAALAVVVLLLYFCSSRHLSTPWIGFLAVLVLLSSHGFIALHVTRTGIYDGPLIFFTTLYIWLIGPFYQKIIAKVYLPEENEPYKYRAVRLISLAKEEKNIQPLFALYHGYQPVMKFYEHLFSQNGVPVRTLKSDFIKPTIDSLTSAQYPFVCLVTRSRWDF